jgi:hypothetical protein
MTAGCAPLRDAVGLVLAVRRGDLDGYHELAKHYELNSEQRGLVSTAIQLVLLGPGGVDFEEFALYLARSEQ